MRSVGFADIRVIRVQKPWAFQGATMLTARTNHRIGIAALSVETPFSSKLSMATQYA